MAAIDRAGVARQADSQSQLPSRKDSLAAQGTQSQSPYSNVPQGSSFKTNISQQNLADPTGRETPPAISASSKLQEELENIDVAAVLQRHEELQAKYIKVKKYYFEKEAQVTQLQNTVAHQRMAVSRTVLDDNEYAARFSRLDGAIKELSFSIRKDWKTVPDWLHSYVNEDAAAVGTKEMTGVGRAVISRWIAEEIFERYFHPGLERTFSERLKTIESNLRRQQVQAITDDDKENQVARISNWRRTTLDGLSDILQSPIMQENQAQLADYLVEKLSATLQCDLKEPSPPELTHGARTIIQNAINIIEKIPQEARDIVVDYIVPGLPVSENTMKIETGLPPLTRPISGEMPPTDRGRDSTDDMEVEKDLSNNSQGDRRSSPTPTHIPQNREQRKKYPFGNLMSKKSMASSTTNPTQSTSSSPSDSRPGNNSDGTTASKDRDEQLSRVRFATFMTVEVRGRGPNNVLIQAPVYTVESS
ncbi:hypothetical protein BGW36DRAFT_308784 [Talaromyces proteolyticus]|uniref:Uncharacterized protein n=1 Tax=Talaromyces proteolyticus TaxID=1131652 RepID=A0AAD4PTW3_9EURO|nr:uncharacterized protein BGW36DRAFT_308784 [Talaromyces proteolyticus]KAH8689401.1 hypothetical protein BGW36DRAFT_308784 [Talaromyces proteolyticus]